MSGRKTFVFTLTTGRSGTAFLTALLQANVPQGLSHHEMIGWTRFGVDTPDLSHLTLFNSQGNVPRVQSFWRQKLRRVAAQTNSFYCETSHVLAKAGLIENLRHLRDHGEVHVIELRRDIVETVRSLRQRGDFLNVGNLWLWYLDPAYPKNLFKMAGEVPTTFQCVWYVLEMRARAAYYRLISADQPWIKYHRFDLADIRHSVGAAALLAELGIERSSDDIVLPGKTNALVTGVDLPPDEEEYIRRVVEDTRFVDPERIARDALRNGFRF